jgi:hypothetical protein
MKNFLFLLLLFLSVHLSAQNVSGLYSGILHNDSARQIQKYELALSEYRGKITGYAYATFIANDTFYYSVRRVKATRDNDQLIVEDQEMVANNFPRAPDKGVHRISYIPLNNLKEGDTLTTFNGNWKTTKTKKFYSAPGSMDMKRDNDSAHSALVAQLRELNILAPAYDRATAHEEEAPPVVARKEVVVKQNTETASKPKAHEDLKKLPTPAAKPIVTSTVAAPLAYTERKKPAPQVFDITADSLVLSFYDNGIVDGDVISVYANGEPVVLNAKLLEAAIKKTIHLNPTTDTVELLLVAETLGSIPPNTGLLVVQDGDARYEVRFSADLQTNAAIVFRKRKQ